MNGWSVDYETVANELDAYNTMVCKQMGWTDWIWEGGVGDLPAPKASLLSQLRQSARHVVAGVKAISEWSIDGEIVEPGLAEKRALICTTCPKNGLGDLTTWFTDPAADLIRQQLESRNQRKIYTSQDPLLGVCQACMCPLRLKIHAPIQIILNKMPAEDKGNLWPACWILAEEKEPNGQKA
jgi:hypothetical protein